MSNEAPREYRFKIIVCGDWAVGKTSLVRRYSTDTFTHDYLTTISVNHVAKHLALNGWQIHLALWDTGGQERFSSLRKKYYQNANGVIFVYDLTRPESYQNIEKRWLPEVNEVTKDYIPTIWAAKADLTEHRVISASAGERLARKLNTYYFETSALTGQNVEKAFTSLSRQILSKTLTTTSPPPRRV